MARLKMDRCSECGWPGVVAQVTLSINGKTRYHGACSNETCRRHRVPMFADCMATPDEAVIEWNGGE